MTDCEIHLALPTDSDAISACLTDAFRDVQARISDFPDVTEGVFDSIQQGLVFVAKSGDTVCGVLTFHATDTYFKIEVIAVPSAFQGKGVGRDLMQAAEDEARTRDLATMRLRTHVLMPENVSLYRHLGWRVESQDSTGVNMARQI